MTDSGCELFAAAILNRAVLDYETAALEIAEMRIDMDKYVQKVIDRRKRAGKWKTYEKAGVTLRLYTQEEAEQLCKIQYEKCMNDLQKIERFIRNGWLMNLLEIDRDYVMERTKKIAKESVKRKFGTVCDFL